MLELTSNIDLDVLANLETGDKVLYKGDECEVVVVGDSITLYHPGIIHDVEVEVTFE